MRFKYLAFFILFSFSLSAQNEGNIWNFGEKKGLNFNLGCNLFDDSNEIQTREGCATICDADGNLLFYTNGGGRFSQTPTTVSGGEIWNQNHQVMYDMMGQEGGGFSSRQSSIITPKPGDPDNFYLFTMDEFEAFMDGTPGRGFSFFEIDMDENGGLGGVVDYQESLVLQSNEAISACRHANGTDYWVVVFSIGTNSFNVFSVTSAGVSLANSAPSPSFLGTPFASIVNIEFSPDGTKMFINSAIFDFDNSTGDITNPTNLSTGLNLSGYIGASFSPNSEYLYISASNGPNLRIFRFETNTTDVLNSLDTIALVEDNGLIAGQMQLAPDGNIYLLESNFQDSLTQLSVIQCVNSDSPCLRRGLNQYGGLNFPFSGLPNFTDHIFASSLVEQELQICLDSDLDVICSGDEVTLTANHYLQSSFEWSTGETTSSIIITEPGLYAVTISDGCCNTGTAAIEILGDSALGLDADIIGDNALCDGESNDLIVITPFGTNIEWSTGVMDSIITVTEAGIYGVTITSACGSVSSDSIEVINPGLLEFELLMNGNLTCGSDVNLSVVTNANIINWSTNETTSEIEITQPGNYSVTLSTGCETISEDFEITFIEEAFQIPNAFTPDNDGVNDDFGPVWFCEEINNFEMKIFNRWGTEVFQTNDPFTRWDGNINDKPAVSDVYVFVLNYVDLSGRTKNENGDITLIR